MLQTAVVEVVEGEVGVEVGVVVVVRVKKGVRG